MNLLDYFKRPKSSLHKGSIFICRDTKQVIIDNAVKLPSSYFCLCTDVPELIYLDKQHEPNVIPVPKKIHAKIVAEYKSKGFIEDV